LIKFSWDLLFHR